MRKSWSTVLLLSTSLLAPARALADWPMPRHDARRSGASPAKSDLTKPVAYWRTYLGGSVVPTGMIAADVNQDSVTEVVYVTGGAVVAKKADDKILWQTPPRGISSLVGIDDIDGDGKLDIVAISGTGAFVLAGATGAIEWTEPEGDMGCLGGARMGDFDGDGKADLLIQEFGCCGASNGKTGFAYSFGAGFAAPALLWTLPWVPCSSTGTTLFDGDGDGKLEIALPEATDWGVLASATGAVLAKTPAIGTGLTSSPCLPIDVDGVAGEELVCTQNYNAGGGQGGRRVYVLKYGAAPASLSQIWNADIGEFLGGEFAVEPRFVVDLDGDGKLEIVVSGMSALQVWTTYVLAAKDGAVLATIPGQRAAGSAPIGSATTSSVFTSDGALLSAWSFDAAASPPLALLWTKADRGTLSDPDWSLVRRSSLFNRPLAADFNGDGLVDLVTRKVSAGAAITVLSGAGGIAVDLATFTLPAGVDPLVAWMVPPVDKPYPELAIARNDGFLTLFDNQLKPTNGVLAGRPGITIGGYYSGALMSDQLAPVVAALGGSADSIVVGESRGALIRLDAKESSFAHPPKPVWARLHTTAPSVVPGLDGAAPGIGVYAIEEPVATPPVYDVAALRADGTTLWANSIPGEPSSATVLSGAVDADAVPDLFVQTYDRGTAQENIRAVSGATGATLWTATPLAGSMMPSIASDFNGDGKTNLVMFGPANNGGTLRLVSGADGSVAINGAPASGWYTPLLVDLDGDGLDEILSNGAVSPARAIAHDLTTTLWASADDDRPYPYAAVAVCPAGRVLVEGSFRFPARLKLTQLAPGSLGTFATFVLAGGSKYADEAAAKAASAWMGQLGDANVGADLEGVGHPVALVGSTDGFLYAVDPCTGNLDFTHDFQAAVGAATLGDTDGDGKDEIVVSVADGYLYALKQELIASPTDVLDTDPPHGKPDQDVDTIVTSDTLYASWKPVAGASGYSIAVVDINGDFVKAWADVAGTKTALSPLPLAQGKRYFIAVRALDAANKPSVDAMSNGVTVILPSMGTGGMGGMSGSSGMGGMSGSGGAGGASSGAGLAGPSGAAPGDAGGCGCRVPAPAEEGVGEALVALVALGVSAVRRRRNRSGVAPSAAPSGELSDGWSSRRSCADRSRPSRPRGTSGTRPRRPGRCRCT